MNHPRNARNARRQPAASRLGRPFSILTAAILPVGGLTPVFMTALAAGLPISLPAEVLADTPAAPAPAPAPGEPLPIKKITLYRSGVGSFQRGGQVSGDSVVNLKFSTDQINDILKSMVVLDLSGGRVESVAYGSKDPLSKRLSSFGVDISDNPSLAELMKRLRGSAVMVTTPDGPIPGTVLGVENRQRAEGNAQQPITSSYLTLVTANGLRAIDIASISAFDIQDKQLAADLSKALAALADQRAERTKTVDISLRGDGTRDIAIAYIHETPVWKTSYRLVLPESDAGSRGDGRPETSSDGRKPAAPVPARGGSTLQGWAIIENPTDEDWKDVRLSLVSGQPVSFQMDLYEPLYSYRPEVPVPTIPGVAPRIFEGGITLGQALQPADSDASGGGGGGRGRAAFDKAKAGEARKSEAMGRSMDSRAPGSPAPAVASEMTSAGLNFERAQMPAAAQGGDVGEIFQYQLNEPVSIQRQQSAMLPIISEGIQSRRVSIYSRSDNAKHPARGVELTNSTDLQLLPGPMTVFDAGNYAGDAQIGHIPPGDHRLLAYAVDLDVDAMVEEQSNSTVNKLRIVNGTIEQTVKQVASTTYGFTNKDIKRARTLIVEHQRWTGWDLVDAKNKPAEKTEGLYRYEVALEAGSGDANGGGKPKPTALTIAQERTDRQYVGLVDFDTNMLLRYSQEGKVSQKVVDAFRDAGARKRAVDAAQQKVRDLETERGEIDKDQARLRENMKSVADKGSQIYSRYLQKLDQQETRMEALVKELEQARANAQKMEQEFQQFIAGLNVE